MYMVREDFTAEQPASVHALITESISLRIACLYLNAYTDM